MKIIQNKPLKKFSYWITDISETKWYAKISKITDKYNKWSIIESELNIPSKYIYEIPSSQIDDIYNHKLSQYQNHIGRLSTETRDMYIIPPKFQNNITNSKIVEII